MMRVMRMILVDGTIGMREARCCRCDNTRLRVRPFPV
jgi:hypothetical protein